MTLHSPNSDFDRKVRVGIESESERVLTYYLMQTNEDFDRFLRRRGYEELMVWSQTRSLNETIEVAPGNILVAYNRGHSPTTANYKISYVPDLEI